MFVVCGEALMDVYKLADTATGATLDARVGGSPFNVAVGLARLTQPVAFLGSVSADFLGERLMAVLHSEGVNTSCVARNAAPTTLSLVGLDTRGVPVYEFYGEGCADRQLTTDSLVVIPATATAFHFGSYATVVEPTAITLRALVERQHTRSVIAYDPNIRLNVQPDLSCWRAQVQWMLTRTHLLKISDEDLSLLYPGMAIEQLATSWLAQGVSLVVVTRGSQGAHAWCKTGHVNVPAAPMKVIDTVGAGDTFQAALLTWLAENNLLSIAGLASIDLLQLDAALRFAAHAAAITCSRRGADLPRRSELPK